METTNNQDNFSVDGIQLDKDNQEFMLALEYALHTNKSLYLTGKAGSGKTTFLKYLRKVTNKKMVVLAPTGIAAINAGGQTIHSFFRIEPSIYTPGDKRLRTAAPTEDLDKSTIFDKLRYNNDKRNVLCNLELMVIDEVSMVRADLLDVVDTILRVYRKNNHPFGGVQVLLIGDTFQLPPVVDKQEKSLLYRFYDSEFFFSANVFQQSDPIYIELKKIYRQHEKDFIELLNRVRIGKLLQYDYMTLNGKLNPNFKPADHLNYITIATTNDKVNKINESKLDELTTPQKTYEATITGEFPLKTRPTDTKLCLKVGAQVMFVKNDWEKQYYNGEIGTVTATHDNEVKVEVEEAHGERHEIVVDRATWKTVIYSWDEKEKCIKEEIIGTFTQYPLRLAWAITVHKSQGLTFERVVADIGNSFSPGQVYVALSRCTSMSGLVLTSEIKPWNIKTDSRVLEFAKKETPETLLIERLPGNKADYYYSEARKALHAREVESMLDNFLSAIKYRNDILTDTFHRYVSTWTGKLFHAEEEGEDTRKKMLSLKKDIAIKDLEIVSAKKSLSAKEKIIESSYKRIKELENQIKKMEAQSKIQQKEIVRISSIRWYQKLLGKK